MLSIDEAIAYAREKADKNSVCCDCTSIKDCKTCEQEHKYEQLAEWLEELKAIKSDGFTDDLLNMGFTKGYNKALNDFVQKVKEHQYVLSDVINSKDYGMFTVGIEQIAEQLKEGKS